MIPSERHAVSQPRKPKQPGKHLLSVTAGQGAGVQAGKPDNGPCEEVSPQQGRQRIARKAAVTDADQRQ
nr:MAG TPA: hypothetical protein [Caudoviricetes sp.]